jgi:hypothetical protein
MKRLLAPLFVVLVVLAAPAMAQAQTTPSIVYETSFVIEGDSLSGWVTWILDNLGAEGFEEAGASFTVWDNVDDATGTALTRSAMILVWVTMDGVTITPLSYYVEYSIATGEIVASDTGGIGALYEDSWADEYPLFTVGGSLWGATLSLDVFWGWFANVTVNLLDAVAEAAVYIRSELDLTIDVSELLIGISDIVEIVVDFDAKPIQLRARVNVDLVLGVYFKLFYDLPMTLDVDVEVLWSTFDIDVFEESWDFSWTLISKQIASWF